jgi:hypothetical protein
MKDRKRQPEQEAGEKERLDEEVARRVAEEQGRKKAYMAKEQTIQRASDSRHSKQAGKRAVEETDRLAREEARKKAYSAKERDMADAHEARRLRDKEHPPE